MVVHIVFFTFQEENKRENIVKTKALLEALVKSIDPLLSIEVGINFDTAQRAMDLSLYATFASKEDLEVYAMHPEHLKVVAFIKSVAKESKVVDYIVE